MHWWQGAFSSASSSKSQSAEDDSVITLKPSGFFSSRRNRQIARARKLRENDAYDSWRSSGSHASSSARSASYAASTSAPQPLPLPELHVLLHRDVARVSASCVPLPSPDTVMNDVVDGLSGLQRLVGQDTPKNTENFETRSSRKSTQTNNLKENHSDNHNYSIPSSCPTSPYSSPVLSPRRNEIWAASQYLPPPGIFQVWSAPEMPHSDAKLGLGFNYYNPSERIASSVDNSPLQSPRIFGTSPQKITSPLNNRISADKPLSGWESNAGHPLPLPPGAVSSSQVGSNLDSPGVSMPMQSTPCSSVPVKPEYTGANNVPSQSSSISSMGSKPEVVPRKSQWQKGKLIGRGTFGSVYVASNRETGALCAMKEVEILPDDSKSAESIRQLEQEIKVLSHLKHPNIVQYYGSEIIGDKFYIYLEYVHPGSINKFIHDHCGAITESVVRNFTRHILCGLAYLHSKKTIHRDIKGANLLVDGYGVVKLADFGMAKHLSGQAAYLSLKGSPYWMAPELLQSSMQSDANSDIALAVDIWSLGCTIIEMMNGKPPWSEYEGAAALFKALKESPPIPESLSAEGKDFLNLCFRRNPADRPTAKKLLEHPFVSSHSQQSDAFNQPLKETRSTDNMQFQRDRSTHRTDQGPFSFESHIKRGKLSSTEANQRSHVQTSSIVVPSPRSMLEAVPTLSPNLVVPIQVSPDPPFNFRSSIK